MARIARRKLRDKRRGYFYCYAAGKRHYLGMDEPKAEAAFRKLVAPLRLTGEPVTVAELILLFTADHPGVWIEEMLNSFDAWIGERAIVQLRPDVLERYATWLKRTRTVHPKTKAVYRNGPQTIRHKVRMAYRLCQYAVKRGWLYELPELPRLPAPVRSPRDLSPAEFAAKLGQIRSPRVRPLLAFMVATGCRPGEARLLEWSDVRLDVGTVMLASHKTAQRTGQPRTIYLTPTAQRVLDAQPRGKWVFPSRTGKPFTKDGLRCICRRAGFRAYQLRHTFAQKALEKLRIEDVATLLGHTDLRSVRVYAQVRSVRARRVAASLSVPELPEPAPRVRPPRRRGRRQDLPG